MTPLCDCEPGPGMHGDRNLCPVHGVFSTSASPEQDAIARMLAKQWAAYTCGPTGTWTQRWIPGVCKHEAVRCTHGDEIIHRGFRRRVCFACGRALRGPLPVLCFFTDEPHTETDVVGRIRKLTDKDYAQQRSQLLKWANRRLER